MSRDKAPRNRAKYDVRLPGREKILLAIYRALSADDRQAVDKLLGTSWLSQARPPGRRDSFSVAVGQLKAGNVSGEHVAYFVNLAHRAAPRPGGAR